jgi:hypothetical protein
MGMSTRESKSPLTPPPAESHPPQTADHAPAATTPAAPREGMREIGGPRGPEPTRFGDWEKNGRCIDF